MGHLRKLIPAIVEALEADSDLDLTAQVAAINDLRRALHDHGPFRDHPVDLVVWLPRERIVANDYNPNTVAPPEMRLLQLSIEQDGYTQPIVTWPEGEQHVVVDGFHRHKVGGTEQIAASTLGFLPATEIREAQSGKGDRMASTQRHNQARGKHSVAAMSEIVMELQRRNWSPRKIGKHLGMEADEVTRLSQVSGLAQAYADREFSEAWGPDIQLGHGR